MLPWILGGALAALAAYALWRLLRRKTEDPFELPDPPPREEREEDADAEDRARRELARLREEENRRRVSAIERRDALIDRVVQGVTFAQQIRLLSHEVVGHEERPSLVPADIVNVRPMRGIAELPRTLLGAQATDDDVFYGRAASGQLPIVEHIERVALTEARYGPARNALVNLQDVSGSFREEQRAEWAVRLNERLIDRCLKEKCEYVLFAFHHGIRGQYHARTPEELGRLRRELGHILAPDGDTNIPGALEAGIQYVRTEGFDEARMVLVTDGTGGTERLDPEAMRPKLAELNIRLHVICIAGDHPNLRAIAERYDLLRN